MLLFPSDRETDRRIAALESRVSWLDEHGSRGVGVLQTQLAAQQGDVSEVKSDVRALTTKVETLQRTIGVRQTVFLVATLMPVYALLVFALIRGHP